MFIAFIIYKACAQKPKKSWEHSYVAGEAPKWASHLEKDRAYVTWTNISLDDWNWIGPRVQTTLNAIELWAVLGRFFPSTKAKVPDVIRAALLVFYSHRMMGAEMLPTEAVAHACSVYYVSDFRASPTTYTTRIAAENSEMFTDPLPALLEDILTPMRHHFQVSVEPRKVVPQP